jgi:two-component system NarL family sensor kinase
MKTLFSILFLLFGLVRLFGQQSTIDSAQYYLDKGDSLYFISDYEGAHQVLLKGLSHASNAQMRTKIFNSMGNALTYTGKKDEALGYYHDALRESRHTEDALRFEAILNKNISALYQESGDYKMAFEYMAKAEKASENWNDPLVKADLLNNKGLLLEYMDSLDQAINSYLKAYTIFEQLQNKQRMSLCANNLGVVYKNLGKSQEAIHYYGLSLNLAKELEDDFLMAANYINLGNLYTSIENYDEAKKHYDGGLELSTKISQPDLIKECLHGYVDLYEGKNDFKNAFQYQKKYQSLSDSLLNKQRIETVAELETRFGLEKKELELEGLATENQKKQLYIIVLLLFCVLMIGGVLLGIRVNKLRRNKRELELIAQTEKQERDRIAQDMHDELGSGISRINWVTSTARNSTASEEDKSRFEHIEGIASQLATGMKSLIWLLYSGNCALDVLTGRLREMASQHADDFGYDLQFQFDAPINQLTLKQNAARDIFLMIKECVNNASKHASAKSLAIAFSLTKDDLAWTINDDGKGFNAASLSTGHGLNNLKRRSDTWNGKVKVVSQEGLGTQVTIALPLKNVVV